MLPFLLFAIIIVPFMFWLISHLNRKHRREWELRYPTFRAGEGINVWTGKLADIKYHCNPDDIGAVIFAVKSQTDAERHEELMAVLRDDGKNLGRIARRKHSDYVEWSKGEVCSGVGLVLYDEASRHLWCNLTVYSSDTSDEQLEAEIHHFLDFVKDNYGEAYIPERYR